MVAFAFSCFAILLYLWLTFGGPSRWRPRATGSTSPSPRRPARPGGRRPDLRRQGGRGQERTSTATARDEGMIEIEAKYAPMPTDTRRSCARRRCSARPTWSSPRAAAAAGMLPDGGTLPPRQVATRWSSTRSSARSTRRRAGRSRPGCDQQGKAVGRHGRGHQRRARQPGAVRGGHRTRCWRSSTSRRRDVRTLVRDTGMVFDALTEREGQLAGLITNSNRVFATTASRDRELAETSTILPTFIDEGRVTTSTALTAFAKNTNPLITQLRPAARELSPTLIELAPPGAQPEGPVQGPRAADRRVEEGHPGHRAVPRRRRSRCCASSTRSCATSTRSCGAWASTSASHRILRQLGVRPPRPSTGRPAPAAADALPAHGEPAQPREPRGLSAPPATNRPNPYVSRGRQPVHPIKVFGTYPCTHRRHPAAGAARHAARPRRSQLPGRPCRRSTRTRSPTRSATAPRPDQHSTSTGTGTWPRRPASSRTPLANLIGQSGKYPHLEEDPAK